MSRIPPELTRTDTRFPDATLFRTDRSRSGVAVADRAISRSRNQRPRWERRYGRTEPPPAAHGRLSRAAFAVTILLLGDRPSPPSGRSPPFSRAKARRESRKTCAFACDAPMVPKVGRSYRKHVISAGDDRTRRTRKIGRAHV